MKSCPLQPALILLKHLVQKLLSRLFLAGSKQEVAQ